MKVVAPRKTWMKDMCEWTDLDTYGKAKRAAEERRIGSLRLENIDTKSTKERVK